MTCRAALAPLPWLPESRRSSADADWLYGPARQFCDDVLAKFASGHLL